MRELRGIPVSSGVVIGRVLVLNDPRERVQRRSISAAEIETERARFDKALDASLTDLSRMRTEAEQHLGKEAAAIFAFHQGMLRDRSLVEPIRRRIEDEKVNAEHAVQEQFRVVAEMFASMPDSAFQTKVDDVWDLNHRVIGHLVGSHERDSARSTEGAVVVAKDLTPTQTAMFRGKGVLGFATDSGGPTSHTAIFARALVIPAVVGLERLVENAHDGQTIILDGDRGAIVLDPDDATIARYEQRIADNNELARSLDELRPLPATTTDGTELKLMGNIEFGEEAENVVENGGDGVGLFRTEFLWLTSDHEPTEDEQYEQYKAAVERSAGRPVTFRTFDLGADKYTQERALVPERNPFLGCRSIRYCLQNVAMFRTQLRAILRAGAHGPIRVMFPLIANISELRQARMHLDDVKEDLDADGLPFAREAPVGMMVEVPSAAVMAHAFAKEADFFSIGTNDLVQYTLAVDRTNERVANLYSPAHPAVLRLIKDVIRAGRRAGIDVSLCGEVGGDVTYTMLLIGLGLRTISSTPSRIPHLKKVVRSVDVPECERLARAVGSFDSETQVNAFIRDQVSKNFPGLLDGRTADG
ncbi:MAG: phosphoenolpyruvate--protein phosphotransferase [Phycisphaeraceae bacterium]|nr:phosphoenolpyruvate--protein phosphotransferase [Phycisphaeraceae bacterium]